MIPTPKTYMLIIAGVFSIIVLFRNAWQLTSNHKNVYDSYSYYFAAKAISEGLNPYDREVLIVLGEEAGFQKINPYLYPPLLASIYRLFIEVNPLNAHKALIFLNIVMLAISWFLLHKIVKSRADANLFFLVYLLIQSFNGAVKMTLRFGQINPLVMLLIILALYFHLKRRSFFSALVLAAATLVKLTPAILLIYFIFFFEQRWRYLLNFAIGIIILVIGSFLLIHPSNWLYYLEFIPGGAPFSTVGSIWGIVDIFSQSESPIFYYKALFYLLFLILSVGISIISIKNVTGENRPIYAFSVLTYVSLFLSPLTWYHHYYFCMLAFFYLPIYFWKEGNKVRSWAYFILTFILLHVSTSLVKPYGILYVWLLSLSKSVGSYVLLLLSIWLFKFPDGQKEYDRALDKG